MPSGFREREEELGGSKRVRGSEREREREESTRVCVYAMNLENWTRLRKVQTLLLFKQGFHIAYCKS